MYCNVHGSAEIASLILCPSWEGQVRDEAPFFHLGFFWYDTEPIYVNIWHSMWRERTENAPGGALFEQIIIDDLRVLPR